MRGTLEQVKHEFGTNVPLIGCEVGIFEGEHAREMFANFPYLFMYLVDSGDYMRQFRASILIKNLQDFGTRARFLNMTSLEAVNLVPDGRLDFIYIDGDHSEKGATDDIIAWYPKVKVGGVIGGHDYFSGHPGVMAAVTKFAKNNGIEIKTSAAPAPFSPCCMEGTDDWYFVKDARVIHG